MTLNSWFSSCLTCWFLGLQALVVLPDLWNPRNWTQSFLHPRQTLYQVCTGFAFSVIKIGSHFPWYGPHAVSLGTHCPKEEQNRGPGESHPALEMRLQTFLVPAGMSPLEVGSLFPVSDVVSFGKLHCHFQSVPRRRCCPQVPFSPLSAFPSYLPLAALQ